FAVALRRVRDRQSVARRGKATSRPIRDRIAVRVAQHGAVDFVESRSGNDGPDGVRVLRDVAKGIRHRDEQFLGWPFAEYEVLAQLAVNPGRRSAQQRAV